MREPEWICIYECDDPNCQLVHLVLCDEESGDEGFADASLTEELVAEISKIMLAKLKYKSANLPHPNAQGSVSRN